MSGEVVIKEIKETPDVADTPFAMAVLNDKGEIAMYGFYDKDVARKMSHIPLYTKPKSVPLTDQEISRMAQELIEVECFDEGEYGMQYNIHAVDFARAIIKASRGEE